MKQAKISLRKRTTEVTTIMVPVEDHEDEDAVQERFHEGDYDSHILRATWEQPMTPSAYSDIDHDEGVHVLQVSLPDQSQK